MDFSEIIVETIVSHPFEENTYLVHLKDHTDCFLVDPGLEPNKILDVIEKQKLVPQAILITHGHADHIGGIGTIKSAWNKCSVYIGEEEAEKLGSAEKNLSAPFGFAVTAPAADRLLRDTETIEVAGISVEVRHTPGHSRGHVVFLIHAEPKSLLFVGDVVFEQSIGRSDFPDGNHAQLIQSIKSQILTLPDDTVICSGHGPVTTVGAERRSNPFLT